MSRYVPGSSHRKLLRRRRLRSLILSVRFKRRVRVIEDTPLDDYLVPFAEPSKDLGMADFVLSLNGSEHLAERRRIESVLKTSGPKHNEGLEAIRNLQDGSLTSDTVNIETYASAAAVEWTSVYFGLDGAAKSKLASAAKEIVKRTFENPTFPGCKFDEKAAAKARAEVGELANAIKAIVADTPTVDLPAKSVLAELRCPREGAKPERAVADILGLVGGPVELVKQAAQNTVHWAIQDPKNWALLRNRALVGEVALGQELEPVLSMVPITSLIPRLDRAQRPVMVALWDARRSDAPRVAPDLNPIFGRDPHKCLGKDQALEALAAMLHPIFLHTGAAFIDDDSWNIRFYN
jgi:cytochrome P450